MLELREHLLDRIQVRRVWRQVEQLGLGGADSLADSWAFVAGQVVHDHDVSRRKGGGEELLDPFGKAGPVDRLIENAGGIYPVTTQCGDEEPAPGLIRGHGFPVTVRHLGMQPLAFGCPAAQRGHVRLCPGFVHKNEPSGIRPPLELLPLLSPPCHLGPQLFGGKNAFF